MDCRRCVSIWTWSKVFVLLYGLPKQFLCLKNVRVRWQYGSPGGGMGDRHLATIAQGVAGDRLPWGWGRTREGGGVPGFFGCEGQPSPLCLLQGCTSGNQKKKGLQRQRTRTFTGTLSATWSWDLLYFNGWRSAAVGSWRLVAVGGWRYRGGGNLVREETCLEKFSTANSGAIFPIIFNDCGAIFPIFFLDIKFKICTLCWGGGMIGGGVQN